MNTSSRLNGVQRAMILPRNDTQYNGDLTYYNSIVEKKVDKYKQKDVIFRKQQTLKYFK